jgi:hypothetical protein
MHRGEFVAAGIGLLLLAVLGGLMAYSYQWPPFESDNNISVRVINPDGEPLANCDLVIDNSTLLTSDDEGHLSGWLKPSDSYSAVLSCGPGYQVYLTTGNWSVPITTALVMTPTQ